MCVEAHLTLPKDVAFPFLGSVHDWSIPVLRVLKISINNVLSCANNNKNGTKNHRELTRSKMQIFQSYQERVVLKKLPHHKMWQEQESNFLEEPHGGFSLETDGEWRESPQYIGVVHCYKSFMVLGICGDKYFQYTFRCPISKIFKHNRSDMHLTQKIYVQDIHHRSIKGKQFNG